jgi:hypothetical protein
MAVERPCERVASGRVGEMASGRRSCARAGCSGARAETGRHPYAYASMNERRGGGPRRADPALLSNMPFLPRTRRLPVQLLSSSRRLLLQPTRSKQQRRRLPVEPALVCRRRPEGCCAAWPDSPAECEATTLRPSDRAALTTHAPASSAFALLGFSAWLLAAFWYHHRLPCSVGHPAHSAAQAVRAPRGLHATPIRSSSRPAPLRPGRSASNASSELAHVLDPVA